MGTWLAIGACVAGFVVTPFIWYAIIVTPLGKMFIKNKDFFKKKIKLDEDIQLSAHKNYANHLSRKNLPDGEFDYVIVGSGMGALTCARLLVQADKRVCLLEAHDRIGGQMHVFQDSPTESAPGGAEFDVGLHYGCGGYEHGPGSGIIATMDHVITESVWEGLDDSFDIVCLADPDTGKRVNSFKTTKTKKNRWNNFLTQCKKLSPGTVNKDRLAMNKLQVLEDKCRSTSYATMLKLLPMPLITWLSFIPGALGLLSGFSDSWGSAEDMLNYIDCSPAFKFLYGYAWGDLGVPPHQVSFRMMSGLIKEYSKGAAYPVGGCIPLVNRCLHRILSVRKSQAFTNAKVTQIELSKDGSKVIGLTVRPGSAKEEISIKCKNVISSIGIPLTYSRLLNQSMRLNTIPQFTVAQKHARPTEGCFITFVTLKKMKHLPRQNWWIFTGLDHKKTYGEWMDTESPDDSNCPLMFVSFPSSKDPTYHDADRFPNTDVCEIVTFVPMKHWELLEYKSADYEAFKQRFADKLWGQALEYFSHTPEFAAELEEKVEQVTGASPMTMDHYINSQNGQMYGLAHTVERFGIEGSYMLRPDAPGVSGLYFTGQDVSSAGYIGAQMGGVITASSILKRNLILDFMELNSKLRKEQNVKKE